MDAAAAEWFQQATSSWRDWAIDDLLAGKGDQRISVVLPAHDEAPTIGGIVETIRSRFIEACPLVDELVVMDSDSTDSTAAIAAEHGATVFAVREVEAALGGRAGKGEAMWKSLFVTTGDILLFIDADLTLWDAHFVSGLLGPLLANPQVELVKGFYDRVLDDGSGRQATQGGRVTELVARPLLNLRWPPLSMLVQPLAGEWGIRRRTLEQLAVPVGYGVELAAVLDVYAQHGLGALAQVDLGTRAHSHQSEHDLAVMAAEVIAVAWRRAGMPGEPGLRPALDQFDRAAAPPWRERHVPLEERPPARSLAAYRGRRDVLGR